MQLFRTDSDAVMPAAFLTPVPLLPAAASAPFAEDCGRLLQRRWFLCLWAHANAHHSPAHRSSTAILLATQINVVTDAPCRPWERSSCDTRKRIRRGSSLQVWAPNSNVPSSTLASALFQLQTSHAAFELLSLPRVSVTAPRVGWRSWCRRSATGSWGHQQAAAAA